MENEKRVYEKVCSKCHCSFGFYVMYENQANHYQGDWCCGSRDIRMIDNGSEEDLKKLRRKIEDRLRKDPMAVYRTSELLMLY